VSAAARMLAAGELLRIEHARGVRVCVQSGALWITEEARNDDVWLRAGEDTSLTGDGLAVLEAIGNTHVRFS
jgi:Protein of unknown function (DUF2917)